MIDVIRKLFAIPIILILPHFVYPQIIDDRIVVAQYGEGIISILQRNEMNPLLYLSDFLKINEGKIGKDSSLFAGNTYLLPEAKIEIEKQPVKTTSNERIYEIFGKKNERIAIKDHSLKDAVFYLVSGHGGPDPGAISKYGRYLMSEDEYSYDVTLRLAKNLLERDAEVYMIVQDKNDGIRNDPILKMDVDELTYPDLEMPINQKARLKQRSEAINKLFLSKTNPYQRLIVIHIDSRSNSENIDVFFYHHHKSKKGQLLAEHLQSTIKAKYDLHQPGRDYHGNVSSRSNLYMVKNTLPPMVYIELGNIKNARDQRRFVLSDNRQALANWLADGIILDYKNAKK